MEQVVTGVVYTWDGKCRELKFYNMNFLGLVDGQVPTKDNVFSVFATPMCFQGIEFCKINNMQYSIVESNWKDNKDVEKNLENIENLKKSFLPEMAKRLNRYSEKNFKVAQWEKFIGPWMDDFLFSIYDKYQLLCKIEKLSLEFQVNIYDKCEANVLDYIEFFSLISGDDAYNLCLYSELIHYLKSVGRLHNVKPFVVGNYKSEVKAFNVSTKRKLVFKIRSGFDRLLSSLIPVEADVVIHGGYLPKAVTFASEIRGGRKVRIIPGYFIYKERYGIKRNVNRQWRKDNASYEGNLAEPEKIIFSLLVIHLPLIYLEGYCQLSNLLGKYYKKAMRPNAIFGWGNTINDELFKCYVMNINRNGEVYDCQHGGCFGTDQADFISRFYKQCDVFCTWGWDKSYYKTCDFKALPASKLMNLKNSKQRRFYGTKNFSILYVCYNYHKYIYRYLPMEIWYDEKHEEEKSFLKKLERADFSSEIVIRLAPETGWKMNEWIIREVPKLKVDVNRNYYKSLYDADLVITADFNTAFLEALVAGKPAISYRAHRMNDYSFEKMDQELINMGVLFDDFDLLLKQIGRIHAHIVEWWNEPSRKEVIERFKQTYTYIPENAFDIWVNEFLSHCN